MSPGSALAPSQAQQGDSLSGGLASTQAHDNKLRIGNANLGAFDQNYGWQQKQEQWDPDVIKNIKKTVKALLENLSNVYKLVVDY